MKKTALFAALCVTTLVGAAPPAEWSGGYPPCSATVTDRCIQLYERGVATAANLALNERLGNGGTQLAMGGPYEPLEYENDFSENWSGYQDEVRGDVMAAEDLAYNDSSYEGYVQDDWSPDDQPLEGEWSEFDDRSGW